MGVLQGSVLSHYSQNNNNNDDEDALVIGSAVANLVVTDTLEKKMVEKALVKLHDEGVEWFELDWIGGSTCGSGIELGLQKRDEGIEIFDVSPAVPVSVIWLGLNGIICV